MRYYSAFSGIGGFELALSRVFPDCRCLGYSEIDKDALTVYRSHFPNHRYKGRIETQGRVEDLDLFLAGFPCTDLSRANTANLGLKGARSGLVYEAKRVIDLSAPKHFLIENVASMTSSNRSALTKLLGVEPVILDARDLSPASRPRLFWASFPIPPLRTKSTRIVDYLLPIPEVRQLALSEKALAFMFRKRRRGGDCWDGGHHSDTARLRASCIVANNSKGLPYNVLIDRREGVIFYRYFSPVEIERLMGFPDGWTEGTCNSARLRLLGNSVSIPVVEHIFKALKDHLGGVVRRPVYLFY